MSAAILQGVPATTIDTDLWVGLPERQFAGLYQIIQEQGGVIFAPAVAALSDDTIVNFLPRVDGLASFNTEYRRAAVMEWNGLKVRVLPLESIIKSKRFVARPKDTAHIPILEQTLRLLGKRPAP